MIRRLIREPLFHFLALAGLIFAVHGFLAGTEQAEDGIEVTQAKIGQLASIFARTWQRPPTADELKGLIDDYVMEEIYVREAMRVGIDKDDTVIRRRLRTKMQFLYDAEAEAIPASDADLQAYLDANPDRFRQPPRVAFEQVYVDVHKRGTGAASEALLLLGALKENAAIAAETGDPTLLPSSMPLSDRQGIDRDFGDEFAATVLELQPGQWQGPIPSAIGLHLVRVTDRAPGRLPAPSAARGLDEHGITILATSMATDSAPTAIALVLVMRIISRMSLNGSHSRDG